MAIGIRSLEVEAKLFAFGGSAFVPAGSPLTRTAIVRRRSEGSKGLRSAFLSQATCVENGKLDQLSPKP